MEPRAAVRQGPSWWLRTIPFVFACALLATFLLRTVPAGADDEVEEAPIVRDERLSKEHYEEGEVLREEQKWSAAADAFWKALDADLLNYMAHVRYQESALKAGDGREEVVADYVDLLDGHRKHVLLQLHRHRLLPPAERLPILEKVAKAHGKVSDVHLEIGRAYLAVGNPKDAVDPLVKALALKVGDRPDVLLLLTEAEHGAGKTEEAIARLDARVKANAEDFNARLALARLQLLAGKHEACAANAAIVLEQRPSFLSAFLVKAEALSALNQIEEALQTLQSAYRARKESDPVVIALADLTARQETEAAYQLAIKYYDEVITRNAENWRAIYGKAWATERMEKWDGAEELYREVVSLRPTSAIAVNSVGFCLYKQGRISEAQVQFKRAVDMDADFVTALNNLGATFDAQAKYADAIKLYERILKMKGQGDNLRALINCAFDYEAGGAFNKALKLLQRAHELLPKDANIVVWLGDNYYFQEKYKDAEKWYQQAIQLDEKQFFAWRGLALSLSQRKKWDDAAEAFEKASSIKPEDLELYIVLGDIYYLELKDLPKALAKYQAFVQRGGNDPEVNDAILEIKKQLEKK